MNQDNLGAEKPSEAEKLSFMMAALQWQEALLQSYRNFLIVTESLFLAGAVASLSVQCSMAASGSIRPKIFLFIIFTCLYSTGVFWLWKMKPTIAHRARAVDWWQSMIMIRERDIDIEDGLLRFRIEKRIGFDATAIKNVKELSCVEIDTMLRKEDKGTRIAFSPFVPAFLIVWCFLFFVGLTDIVLSLIW